MTMYGFVVVAWLVSPYSDGHIPIPFASWEACIVARVGIVKRLDNSRWSRAWMCVGTGAGK